MNLKKNISKHIRKSLVTLAMISVVVALLTGCAEDRTYQYVEKTSQARWIESAVIEWWLWGDSVKELSWNDYFLKGDNFLKKTMASAKVQDKWSYCSNDTLLTDHHQRGTFNHLESYGLDVVVMTDPTGVTSRQYGRVVTVYAGSPAERVGFQRNDFIASINDKKVTTSNVSELVRGRQRTLAVARLSYDLEQQAYFWGETDTLTLETSEYVEDKAFPYDEVYDVNGLKTGYLMCARLTERAYEQGGEGTDYRADLDRIMARFKSAGIGALIVDLRLCNYGDMSMVSRLAAYIAGRAGQPLLQTEWKDSKSEMNETVLFDAAVTSASLGLERVYFITGKYTCGAAEWLIHGLRGTMGEGSVFTIGETTAGQGVVTHGITSDEYFLTVHLSVARLADANGMLCGAIVPTEEVSELSFAELHPYADPQETLLDAAIQAVRAVEGY